MKAIQNILICALLSVLGCCNKDVDKCNNSCGDRAICDDNGICNPKSREDFYNPKTGKYEHFFATVFSTFPHCIYYNYSYADTPWIMPSMMDIGSNNRFNGIDFQTLVFDSLSGVYEEENVNSYDLVLKKDGNNKVTDINIIYVAGGVLGNNLFFDYNLEKKYFGKSVVSSWVGKVSQDRKRIDFTIYFYVNKSQQLFENSDTVKIINRSYVVHPECRTDCRFCFECE